jgi:hypothetical protein
MATYPPFHTDTPPTRLVTLHPTEPYPVGIVIDVYFSTWSGAGYGSTDEPGRDTWLYYGNPEGDGWWWRVRDPRHAQVMGYFRNASQITEHLGIDMSPANLMKVGQRFWPDEAWRAARMKQLAKEQQEAEAA